MAKGSSVVFYQAPVLDEKTVFTQIDNLKRCALR